MLASAVVEQSSAPGNAVEVTLAAGVTGRRTFANAYASGASLLYGISNGSKSEWGIGRYLTSPNRLSRDTVLGNSDNNTSRIAFTGLTYCFTGLPAERMPYINNSGVLAYGAASIVARGALVKLTTNQSISSNTNTAISWSSAEYDAASLWSAGSPTRLTVPTGVQRIRLSGNARWALQSGGVRDIFFRKNGSTASFPGGGMQRMGSAVSTSVAQSLTSAVLAVAAGDYFEMFVLQDSGSTVVVEGTFTAHNWFSMEILG